MEEEKLKGVLEQLTPKGFKDVQKFLELANYYQWFIKDFATIARLLYNLVKKNQKWDWTERQEKGFQELKKRFTKELVLAVPDLDKKMRMEVNTSDYVTSSFLSMEYQDGRQRLVAFLSKSLNKTERNYEIHNKKILVVIRRFMNAQNLNRRQAYQALYVMINASWSQHGHG